MELWLAILLVIGAVGLLVLMRFVQKRTNGLDGAYYREQWQRVEQMANAKEPRYLEAIIAADTLVDKALKQTGFKGKTMGERMASANRAFTNSDTVWNAHKLRNKLVHETDVKLNKKVTVSALTGFKRALKDLGAL